LSIAVECDDRAEIDRLWDALEGSGSTKQCGWLRGRWSLCWQIVLTILGELMSDPDRGKVKRVAEAMLKMVEFDIADLQHAARGAAR
jgi:predicted 3-demethylubiquinone-9 3-methyltransferase (glyoxalase superfamily)